MYKAKMPNVYWETSKRHSRPLANLFLLSLFSFVRFSLSKLESRSLRCRKTGRDKDRLFSLTTFCNETTENTKRECCNYLNPETSTVNGHTFTVVGAMGCCKKTIPGFRFKKSQDESLSLNSPPQPCFGMSRNAPPKETAAHNRTTFFYRY